MTPLGALAVPFLFLKTRIGCLALLFLPSLLFSVHPSRKKKALQERRHSQKGAKIRILTESDQFFLYM